MLYLYKYEIIFLYHIFWLSLTLRCTKIIKHLSSKNTYSKDSQYRVKYYKNYSHMSLSKYQC